MTDTPQTEPRLVRDLMTVGVMTCAPDDPVPDLARALLEKDLEAIVVLDMEGHAVGIVGRKELLEAYAHGEPKSLTAEEVMHEGLPQAPPDIPLAAAAQFMLDQGQRVLFLTHHAGGVEYPAAVFSCKHILRHIALREGEDLRDLGIKADRQTPIEQFIKRRDEARRRNIGNHDQS